MFGPTRSIIFRGFLIGVAAGLRSMTAGAVLAWHRDEAPRSAGWKKWPLLRSTWGRRLLIVAAAGETVGDKLPATPSRLEPAPLGGRIVFGALAGAAVGTEGHARASVIRGAISGGIGAVAGSYAGYHARAGVVEATGLPDAPIAVVEDVAAIALAATAVRNR